MALIEAELVLDGKYKVVTVLGGGAFGVVYLARDIEVGHRVALKFLKEREELREAELIHEMQVLEAAKHPGTVRFLHHFRHEGVLCLAMEYCEGGTLAARIRGGGASAAQVAKWGQELAETLHAVHERGMVHYDIKPANILLDRQGALKIGDFGLANSGGGTITYSAPEIWYGEGWRDRRVDVYALGVTLLEARTGVNPFLRMERGAMHPAKLRHDFVPAELEGWLREVVLKATHPTRELRFQTAEELREALESKRVSYQFSRRTVQAQKAAEQAEKALGRGRLRKAETYALQALKSNAEDVRGRCALGRFFLRVGKLETAEREFNDALRINPRVQVQKELGWLCLERSDIPRAISMLSDHLRRNGADFEAHNLLVECFFRAGKYDEALRHAQMICSEKPPSRCFETNVLACRLMRGETVPIEVKSRSRDAFYLYNWALRDTNPSRWHRHVIFEDYRFGLAEPGGQEVEVVYRGEAKKFTERLITLGRGTENMVQVAERGTSLRHAVVANWPGEVWVYDLKSTSGSFVEGVRVERKAYVDGVKTVTLGCTEVSVGVAGVLI